MRGNTNPAKKDEVRKKISDARNRQKEKYSEMMSGRSNPMYKSKVEVTCEMCGKKYLVIKSREDSTRFCGKKCLAKFNSKRMKENNPTGTGKDNPAYGKATAPKPYYPDELDHIVRSSWEEEIALMFKENDINYFYEPNRFERIPKNGNASSYTPDFFVGFSVIEVKGWLENPEKYKSFYQAWKNIFDFIIVGNINESLDSSKFCDKYIPWQEREKILEAI